MTVVRSTLSDADSVKLLTNRSLSMKSKLFGCLFFATLTSGSGAHAGDSYFYSKYGTDGFLMYSSSRRCFVTLRGSCDPGATRINSFAVESGGTLYCDKSKTPLVDRPLLDFAGYGTNQRFISTCTIKGWKHLPI